MALKSTGVVRRIDDLGRVVIPKAVRTELNIQVGDALEIFTDPLTKSVVLKKYGALATENCELAEKVLAKSQIVLGAIYDSYGDKIYGNSNMPKSVTIGSLPKEYHWHEVAEYGWLAISHPLDDGEECVVATVCDMLTTMAKGID